VRVTATVDEFFGETQLENVEELLIIGSGASVTPATVVLPAPAVTLNQDGDYEPDLEAYEGMLVSFPDTLQIVEQFQLDRFNEVKLVQGPRPFQFTQVNAPSAALLDDYEREIGARRITYDDGLNEQNANVGNLDGFGPVYTTASAPRMGDTVTGLTGVLDYKWAGNRASGATWRLRSVANGSVQFVANAPRPDAPLIGSSLTVASLNVLNFFRTIDDGSATALGFEPRGADSAAEFQRQRDKLVLALAALDADIVGLVELENEFDATQDVSTAIEELVSALNSALGSDAYRAVYPGQGFVGSDAIAVGVIYRRASVRIAPGSQPAILDDAIAGALPGAPALPIFDGSDSNRAPLAVSFEHLASGEVFTVAVNHFKSKGGSGTDGNADAGDGAGAWNQRRLDAAIALQAWLETAPTGAADDDRIILGDLNAYAQEDPIQYLLANGYRNVEDTDDYSYVFDGQVGSLDYILVSDAFADRLAGAAVWNINADEADALDYNLDFGRDPTYFDDSSPARNSDHDPLIAGFDLVAPMVSIADIIELTLEGLDDGSLEGTGPNSTVQDLNERSFVARLRQAEQREQRGIQQSVCQIMRRAALQTDGDPRPTDQLTGSGLAALFDAISSYRADNCDR
jgi:predicted extracellular nuclease